MDLKTLGENDETGENLNIEIRNKSEIPMFKTSFVLCVSDLNNRRTILHPDQRGFLRPSDQREERSY
jgi:hypothetical protein